MRIRKNIVSVLAHLSQKIILFLIRIYNIAKSIRRKKLSKRNKISNRKKTFRKKKTQKYFLRGGNDTRRTRRMRGGENENLENIVNQQNSFGSLKNY